MGALRLLMFLFLIFIGGAVAITKVITERKQ